MPSFAGVNHFALSVTDLDVSQRFYSDVLGPGRPALERQVVGTVGEGGGQVEAERLVERLTVG